MKKAGVQIDSASPAFVWDIQAKAQPMIDAWIKDVRDQRNLDGAMLLNEFRKSCSALPTRSSAVHDRSSAQIGTPSIGLSRTCAPNSTAIAPE
jgi:hypothetical protein